MTLLTPPPIDPEDHEMLVPSSDFPTEGPQPMEDTQHLFTAKERDWGYTTFLHPTELNDPGKGFLVDDKIIIEADITFPKVH